MTVMPWLGLMGEGLTDAFEGHGRRPLAVDRSRSAHGEPPVVLRAGQERKAGRQFLRRIAGAVERLADDRRAEVGIIVDLQRIARGAFDAIPQKKGVTARPAPVEKLRLPAGGC